METKIKMVKIACWYFMVSKSYKMRFGVDLKGFDFVFWSVSWNRQNRFKLMYNYRGTKWY